MVLGKVGLTGCSGMVGRHVLEELQKDGVICVGTSRRSVENILPNLTCFLWDLGEWKQVDELSDLFGNIDALFHVGAFVPSGNLNISNREMFDTNVRSCLCISEYAIKEKIPLVFLSGATVYDDSERDGIFETDKKTCGNSLGGFYGYSKWLAEEVFRRMEYEGLKCCILRPSSIYGYGLDGSKMITNFLLKASRGETINLVEPVTNKIDLIHASDVARAMVKALKKESWGVYNVACEKPSSILEIVETCIQVVGAGHIEVIPSNTNNSNNQGKVRFGLNCGAARDAFEFDSKVSLLEGIKMLWNSMTNIQKK